MVEVAKPKNSNQIGLVLGDYKGVPSTLCQGCGHDAITSKIIKAFFELSIDPYQVVKLSGIGCSSKTPAYFLNRSSGFNAVHGRMPSVATGASLINKNLIYIGVSGDGDTGNIGIGQFMHCIRRNIPLVYIIENNGVYGLTKGQFSATADYGSKLKSGEKNTATPIDCCAEAIDLGCGFVARSFAGDPKQLTEILKAALCHKGTAIIDVISPCITFNNHEGSTKSYDYTKAHDIPLHEIGFIPNYDPLPDIEHEPGTVKNVKLADGSHIHLKKLALDYDPTNKGEAIKMLEENKHKGEILTGILYVNTERDTFTETNNVVDHNLALLSEEEIKPNRKALEEIMESFR